MTEEQKTRAEWIMLGIVAAIAAFLVLVSTCSLAPAQAPRWIHIPSITVRKPADSAVTSWSLRDTGAVYVRWRLDLVPSDPKKPAPLFNHFCKHESGGQVTLSTHYYTYQGTAPALQLSLGWQLAIKTPRGAIAPWVRGRTYTIFAFWRPIGQQTEIGIFLDGRLVGHRMVPRLSLKTYQFPLRIGAEKLCSSCIDPSFPSVHWIDGWMEFVIWSPSP